MTKKNNKVKSSMTWVCPNGHKAGRTSEETKRCPICREKMHKEYKLTIDENLQLKD